MANPDTGQRQPAPQPDEVSPEEAELTGKTGYAQMLADSAATGYGTMTAEQFQQYQIEFNQSQFHKMLGGAVSRASNGHVFYEGPLYNGGKATKVDVTNRIKGAFEHLKSLGLTDAQANAFIGNCMGESRTLNPFEHGDGGAAAGICQWHPDRQARFVALKGYRMDDPNAMVDGKPVSVEQRINDEIDFGVHELKTTEKAAGNRFFAAGNNMEEAVRAMVAFERPADQAGAVNTRYGYAAGLARQLKADPLLAATPGNAKPKTEVAASPTNIPTV